MSDKPEPKPEPKEFMCASCGIPHGAPWCTKPTLPGRESGGR